MQTNSELIKAVLADKDHHAFECLVERYERPVWTIAWQIFRDYHATQDTTQETFLIAYKCLHELRAPMRSAFGCARSLDVKPFVRASAVIGCDQWTSLICRRPNQHTRYLMSSEQSLAEQTAEDRGCVTVVNLFSAHAQAVFAVCLANTQHYHDAEDVMQSVFLKASEKISSLREPARARAWLLQVARRKCIDFHRRRKPTEPLSDEPSTTPFGASSPCERLQEAIQELPHNFREVIVLYYMDGRTCSKVASSLGLTEQAVRQRLVRARAMLHDLLREEQE